MPKRNSKSRNKKQKLKDDVQERSSTDPTEVQVAPDDSEADTRANGVKPVSQIEAEPDGNQDDEEPVLATAVIFQCASCRSIIGDTISGFDAHSETQTITLKAARNVVIDNRMQMSAEGFDAGCTFRHVKCSHCDHVIGRVYSSTTPALDNRRSTYSLDNDALQSYQLGSCRDTDGKFVTLEEPQANVSEGQPMHGSVEGSEKRYVSVATFETLRDHVASLTEAFNKAQEAITELREREQSVPELRDSLDNVENMMLLWEDRFKNLETYKRRTEACESRLDGFSLYDEQLSACKDRITQLEAETAMARAITSGQHSLQTQPTSQQPLANRPPARLKSSPSIRRTARSPTRTPLRRVGQTHEDSPFPKRKR